MTRSFAYIIISLIALSAFSCSKPMRSSHWMPEIVFETRGLIGGCAIGDLDASKPGYEIVALCRSGEIHMIYRSENTWKSKLLFTTPGEMIQCAIGDADPDRPGQELVAVGMSYGYESSGGPGAAYLVYKRDGDWKGEKMFDDVSLLHGVCIGEGGVFVAGYSQMAHRLSRIDQGWTAEKVADLPGAGKSAAPSWASSIPPPREWRPPRRAITRR